uniref:Uncharacterized protein n=1 Tax=Anopheles minimus TaxID=112268 RepID=A0A182WP35_9DIPT
MFAVQRSSPQFSYILILSRIKYPAR